MANVKYYFKPIFFLIGIMLYSCKEPEVANNTAISYTQKTDSLSKNSTKKPKLDTLNKVDDLVINQEKFKVEVVKVKDSLELRVHFVSNRKWNKFIAKHKGFGDFSNFKVQEKVKSYYRNSDLHFFCFNHFPGKILFVFNTKHNKMVPNQNGVLGPDVIYGEEDIIYNPNDNTVTAIRSGRSDDNPIIDKYKLMGDSLFKKQW